MLFFDFFGAIYFFQHTKKCVGKKISFEKIQVCAHFVFLDVFRGQLSGSINICKNKNSRNQKCIKFKSLIKLTAFHKICDYLIKIMKF